MKMWIRKSILLNLSSVSGEEYLFIFFLDVVKSVGFKWRIFTYFLLIFGYDEFERNVEIKFVKELFDR